MSAVAQLRSPSPAREPALDLIDLARSKAPDDRRRLLLGVVALCEAAPPNTALAPALAEIFLTLAAQAERDIRRLLSERLAAADWAPPALINMLALDEIEIAAPVIAASPLLQDADLIRILLETTLEHQIAVARRPHLSHGVVEAIVDQADPVTMTALASNRTADISDAAMRRLIEHSRRIAGLRAPLTRHPRLNADLAHDLYQWVGQALRQSIGERFKIDDARLNAAVREAAAKAVHSPTWRPLQPTGRNADRERQEMEKRLVDKLQAAGQLRPGILIRALREQRLSLFEQALVQLGGFTPAQVRSAIHSSTAEPLYLACTAVGLDRAVFANVLSEVRKLTDGRPGGGAWSATPMNSRSAARAFRQIMERTAIV
ncbi:DUF2336 domain-containing protein [Brevundimonas aurantiaca]|uniref:DUF2336 domain-containing protein n=1 Tax=Brevundimonas aurantiaca TaxID=74316 RepID=UPI001D191581|nr:DUF2336 domain-containing protein [Brevundimonas aurantiaca]MCC4293780.1 DUF2336 domain-containing protein [Brevundimonas aurantiaca]